MITDEEIQRNISGFSQDIKQYASDRDWTSAKRIARSLHKALIVMERQDAHKPAEKDRQNLSRKFANLNKRTIDEKKKRKPLSGCCRYYTEKDRKEID